jgi:hypothetical protein
VREVESECRERDQRQREAAAKHPTIICTIPTSAPGSELGER